MKGVHRDIFDKACDIHDLEGFDAAKNYLIDATKGPYKPKYVVPYEMPKIPERPP